MFRRRLFFWFEKLKITPAERYAVALLLLVLVGLSAAPALLPPPAPAYGPEYYRELDRSFRALSPGRRDTAGYSTASPGISPAPGTLNIGMPADTVRGDSAQAAGRDSLININTADAATLQRLPGIGPVYASRIVAYRETFGSFETLGELVNIRGIGEKRLEKIKAFIKLRD